MQDQQTNEIYLQFFFVKIKLAMLVSSFYAFDFLIVKCQTFTFTILITIMMMTKKKNLHQWCSKLFGCTT